MSLTNAASTIRTIAALLLAAAPAACSSILDVELPTRVPAETLDDPALATTLVQGAIGDFECALTNYITATGLLGDELIESTGWIAVFSWDQRRIFADNFNLSVGTCTELGYGIFAPIQTARFQAEDAFAKITAFADADVPNKALLLATAAAYAGYAYTLLGEAFCEATVDAGPLLTPDEVLAIAEERFTTAITGASTGQTPQFQNILNMARVGRARVRLDLGKLAEAAADAQLVPEGFAIFATRSIANERRWNRTYADGQRNFYLSVDPRYRGLTVDGAPDPRVPTADAGRNGHDGTTRVWFQLKYPSEAAPIPIASWREAQLIIAEALGGQAAVDAINRLRDAANLPPFAATDPQVIASQVREERRRELFLEGQRFNDMLRFSVPFDSGIQPQKGVAYGTTTCLPLPDDERNNNPNLTR